MVYAPRFRIELVITIDEIKVDEVVAILTDVFTDAEKVKTW